MFLDSLIAYFKVMGHKTKAFPHNFETKIKGGLNKA